MPTLMLSLHLAISSLPSSNALALEPAQMKNSSSFLPQEGTSLRLTEARPEDEGAWPRWPQFGYSLAGMAVADAAAAMLFIPVYAWAHSLPDFSSRLVAIYLSTLQLTAFETVLGSLGATAGAFRSIDAESWRFGAAFWASLGASLLPSFLVAATIGFNVLDPSKFSVGDILVFAGAALIRLATLPLIATSIAKPKARADAVPPAPPIVLAPPPLSRHDAPGPPAVVLPVIAFGF